MQGKIYYVFITLSLVFCCSCSAPEAIEAEKPSEAMPAADLIRQADEAFKGRTEIGKLREAIALLKRARSAEERNHEAAWKLAQFNYILGKSATEEKESEKAFADCISAGAVASRIAPDQPDGYFWQAACYGGEAERSPFSKGLTAVEKVRQLMGKVIEIQPGYQNATAYVALAIIEIKTEFVGGKPEKAVAYLNEALKLNPGHFLARLTLAEAYLALDRDAEAKKELESVLKIKPSAELQPEYKEVSEKARKLLQSKFR